ncbi:MAG: antitoxin VapB family protein [Candidatus Bathyarchaeia archaeon]
MPSKNISITEDVYEMISKLKLEGESFSDVIRRLAERGRIEECAGLWSDMPDKEFQAIRDAASTSRDLLNESVRNRLEAS